MSFSPRARPNTVNLSFTDQDLTDTYRDEISFNNTSNLSSPRHRHARGDTPLSTAKSRGQSSRTASTSSWTGNEEKSNLDKLLDFLDDEETEAEGKGRNTRRMERSIATSTPPPVTQHPLPNQQNSSSNLSSRSLHQPNPSFYRSQSPPYSTTPSTITRPTRDQPILKSRDDSHSSPRNPQSTISHDRSLSRVVTGRRVIEGGEELPDSPSPRPGSVAAMRGDRSGVTSRSANHSRSHSFFPQGEEEEEVNQEEGREGSMDSIERVAEAALREFDTIVSSSTSRQRRGSRSPSSRPPSRFTAISPEPSLPPSHVSANSPHQQNPNPLSSVDPHQINLELLKELREAQDYICYLQDELRGINHVVGQLRERGKEEEEAEEEEALHRSNGRLSPLHRSSSIAVIDPVPPGVAADEQLASLEIVKHLIALLPTSSLSSLSSTRLSLTSIASALEFTRRIDSLAYGGVRRREEDVFNKDNLEELVGRVALREYA